MALPKRTFSASQGQTSTGTRGPDQIESDLDTIFAMFDPLETGIGSDSINPVVADDSLDFTAQALSAIAAVDTGETYQNYINLIASLLVGLITGVGEAKTLPAAIQALGAANIIPLKTLTDKFHATTGHTHAGTTGNGTLIAAAGLATDAVETLKIKNDAVTDDKIFHAVADDSLDFTTQALMALNATATGLTYQNYMNFIASALVGIVTGGQSLTLAEAISAINAGTTLSLAGLSSRMLNNSGTVVESWATGLVIAGYSRDVNLTVTGAALGDFAIGSLSKNIAGLQVTAKVTATNTVTVTLYNITDSTLAAEAGVTVYARVIKK